MTEKQIKNAFNSTRNLFITGAAGVGKSFEINEYVKEHPELNFLLCAPTGIAALNIGGITMHKAFHIPVPAFESPSFAKGKKGALTESMIKAIIKADVIIIDEISMCRNDVFSFAIKVLRKAERIKGSKIRLIVSGDFSQLPPIVKKTDEKLMKKFGFDVSGFPFTTREWKSCNFKVVEFTEVKRQNDVAFIKELNKIRIGDYSTVDYFNQFVTDAPDYEDAICICGTNAEADRLNQEYLDSLDGSLAIFRADKEGRCSSGLIEDLIIVKEGCRIIFTSNDNIKGHFKNGTFGTIASFKDNCVAVQIGDKIVDVYKVDYSINSYTVSGNVLTKKEIGKIRQYPFKIGKAITIHKSQGQTFDKVVISPKVFAVGQLYVALSRVSSPEGLQLTDYLSEDMLILNEVVQTFYANGCTYEVKAIKKPKVTVRIVKRTNAKRSTTRKPVAKKTTAKTTTKKTPTKALKSSTVKKKINKTVSKPKATKSSPKARKSVSKATSTKKSTTKRK